MNDFTKGQLTELAAQVAAGAKPVAEVSIKSDEGDECTKYVHQHYPALFCYLEGLGCEWATLWIMKDRRMIPIIRNRPRNPVGAVDHFYLGKLFGYSDAAILDFIDSDLKRKEAIK